MFKTKQTSSFSFQTLNKSTSYISFMTRVDDSDRMNIQMKQSQSCDYFATLLIEIKVEES
jgi:hypothetical protein